MRPVITLDTLKAAGACSESLKRFAEDFPDGTPATKPEALAAALCVAGRYPWDWAAERMFGRESWRIYTEAKAEPRRIYDEATAESWRIYDEAKAEAFVNTWFSQCEED